MANRRKIFINFDFAYSFQNFLARGFGIKFAVKKLNLQDLFFFSFFFSVV